MNEVPLTVTSSTSNWFVSSLCEVPWSVTSSNGLVSSLCEVALSVPVVWKSEVVNISSDYESFSTFSVTNWES